MRDERFVRRAQPWLGTIVEIAVPAAKTEFIDGAFAIISDVHCRMSFHSETSDLALLRRASPGDTITINKHTIFVLREAKRFYAVTNGLFDLTIAAELVKWGFLPRHGSWTSETIAGTMDDIEIVDDSHVVVSKPLLIDLGGIAKGYAVDSAVKYLQESGVDTGVVNAGGDLRVFGNTSWPVTLRAADWSGAADELTLEDGAVATSANETTRTIAAGAWRTPHIGKKRNAKLFNGSVSVFAPFAIHADALTKVAIADEAFAASIAPDFDAEILYSANN